MKALEIPTLNCAIRRGLHFEINHASLFPMKKPPAFLFFLLAALLVAGLRAAAPTAELRVANRTPLASEVGYRPSDGETVRLNPPSFIWLHEREAVTYSIQWSRTADFRDATGAENFAWNTYTHREALAPGEWFWRYRFTARDGRVSSWSVTRRVNIPKDAVAFPMPSRTEQRERVPAGHPRLFLRPEDLPRLRELAKGREKERFAKLLAEAERIAKAEPLPEPTEMGSARDKKDEQAIRFWWPNRERTETACKQAETLAFVYLMTGEKRFGDAARKHVLHLASWNPDGPTNFRLNCEAAKPMLYRLPRAYDWAWDTFTPAERGQIQAVMARRVKDAWDSGEVGRGVGHLNSPYSSHGNRVWHKIGEAGIAFLGEIPEAETWLDYAVNKFYACYPVWSDDDGGWHEGVAYWSGYMSKVVWWLQIAQTALAIDGSKKPFFAQVGDYPLYIAPPGSPNAGFGDLSNRPPSTSVGSFMEYHLRTAGNSNAASHAGYWRWWTQTWKMGGADGILGFLYHANLPALPAAKPPSDLPPSKVFRGIGVASLHTTLLDSADDVHFLFKSSPFGSQSHGHNPQNSFQLNAYGAALLPACVYRDLHGSAFHSEWAQTTQAQNAVLVNGEGQIKRSATATGHITDFRFSPECDFVTGDATVAYGKLVRRALRHVAFIKPDLIVLCDDLATPQPATFQFLLHGLSAFTLDEPHARLTIEQPKAGLTAQYLPPASLTFRQWSGYPMPMLRDMTIPEQWHVEASTTDKCSDLQMLTVLVPWRTGKRTEWTAQRIESPTAVGTRIRRGDESLVVAFRKSGVTGEATLEGLTFDAPSAFRREQ